MVEKLDRHARQDKRAKAVIAHENGRIEKRKNGLPPFLMVRSGLLKCWIPTMVVMGGFALSVLNAKNIDYERTNWPAIVFCVLGAVAFINSAIKTDFKRSDMMRDIETIQAEFYRYMNISNYPLDFSETVKNKKLMRILIEHIVKYDPGIFDKMIANPESVNDFDVRNDIIRAQLKEHPENATKIINMFNREEVSDNLYKKAQRYAKRLKVAEQCK